MKHLSQILSVIALTTLVTTAPAASRKRPAKKTAPKKVVVKGYAPRKYVTRKFTPAPPSAATRPTDDLQAYARQRAVDIVKAASDAYARGDYQRTVTLCKLASDQYPTYARAQTWMGAGYQKLGNTDKAISAYRWARALAPGTVDAERAERGLRELGHSIN